MLARPPGRTPFFPAVRCSLVLPACGVTLWWRACRCCDRNPMIDARINLARARARMGASVGMSKGKKKEEQKKKKKSAARQGNKKKKKKRSKRDGGATGATGEHREHWSWPRRDRDNLPVGCLGGRRPSPRRRPPAAVMALTLQGGMPARVATRFCDGRTMQGAVPLFPSLPIPAPLHGCGGHGAVGGTCGPTAAVPPPSQHRPLRAALYRCGRGGRGGHLW